MKGGSKSYAGSESLAYWIFFWLGLGNLFPWNTFITASYYFAARFCGTSFEETFENYFSVSFTLTQTIGLALTIRYCEGWNFSSKVIYPLVVYSIIFLVTTIMVAILSIDPSLFFGVTMLSTAISGMCGSLLSAGLFSLAAFFPQHFTGALMNGQGLAGLTVSLSSLITSAAGARTDLCGDDVNSNDEDCDLDVSYSALAYFAIATFVLVSCIGSFIVLMRLPITKYYLHNADKNTNDLGTDVLTTSLLNPLPIGSDEFFERTVDMSSKSEAPETDGSVKEIFKVIRVPALAVFFTFMVTIGVFPSIVVLIESEHQCESNERFYNDLFLPFLFLLYNIFDFTGRVLAEKIKPLLNKGNILTFALCRSLLIPLILLCNISESKLPILLKNDAFPCLIVSLIALTNGYTSSCSMMLGPSLVTPKDAGIAASIMIFALTLGLLGGGVISFLILFISQGSV
jgi:solute carrier family 29 (equilibrative nucleoside transporter), member 1/2/3